ncbi:hypothetical protein CDCA_CDCA18G4572 [Cyanidium caldarium]|uniref:Uncharacterized protein n=1 Tax=Cyanidium caldarium TaxID=2771 RepID=A0AAV9J1Q9_CYACA|nr:hypothetical protein CDCA_CDCA18G4572 [Cyanidium caldarium]
MADSTPEDTPWTSAKRIFGSDLVFYGTHTPPELLRRLVRLQVEQALGTSGEAGASGAAAAAEDRRTLLQAMQYLPHAIFKLLQNMPMPHERLRQLPVLYHESGALALVDAVPRAPEAVWLAQCGVVWRALERAHAEQPQLQRMRLPVFDDDEPPLDYAEHLYLLPVPPGIGGGGSRRGRSVQAEAKMDVASDDVVLERAIRDLPAPEALATLYRLASPWTCEPEALDPSQYYLRDRKTLWLLDRWQRHGRPVPHTGDGRCMPVDGARNGDTFSDTADDDAWDALQDHRYVVQQQQQQQPVSGEYRCAYPFLYGKGDAALSASSALHWYAHPPRWLAPRADRVVSVSGRSPWYLHPALEPLEIPEETGGVDPSIPSPPSPPLSDMPPLSASDLERVDAWLELLHAPSAFRPALSLRRKCLQHMSLMRWWCWRRREASTVRNSPKARVAAERMLHRAVRADFKVSRRRCHRQRRHSQRARHRSPPSATVLALPAAPATCAHDPAPGDLLTALERSGFFRRTQMDWLEAGLILCRQAHAMMTLLLRRKNFHFLHLDYNFNLKPVRTLTTKERKRARFGNAFHLLRELCRLTKLLVDAHAAHRLGVVPDAYQLADGVMYALAHVGQLTGIYRYKYRVMRQIRQCKHLKHLLYARFGWRGPGKAFWLPLWRCWVQLVRGLVPLLEQWLANLLSRHFQGRLKRTSAQRSVTGQRMESQYDSEWRQAVLTAVLDMLPPEARERRAQLVLRHLGEAWRCYKSNRPWQPVAMPEPIERVLRQAVQQRATWWRGRALRDRARLLRGATMDKAVARQSHGRLSRLLVMQEQRRQREYWTHGPWLSPEEAVRLLQLAAAYVRRRQGGGERRIPLPSPSGAESMALLQLALESLQHEAASGRGDRLLAQAVEQAADQPRETLARIHHQLQHRRTFSPVSLHYQDDERLTPVHRVDAAERITDAFVDQYLWREASRRQLFPVWMQPADDALPPVQVHRLCERIAAQAPVWWPKAVPEEVSAPAGQHACTAMVQVHLTQLAERVELVFLNRLLRLIVDEALADYLTAKCNVMMSFKDMQHTNSVGVPLGLAFAGFLLQWYAVAAVDLPLLASWTGTGALDGRVAEGYAAADGAAWLYQRTLTDAHLLVHLPAVECRRLVRELLLRADVAAEEQAHLLDDDYYPTKRCWPRAQRMRLATFDCHLGRSLFERVREAVPSAVVSLSPLGTAPVGCHVSVVSGARNPYLHWELHGWEVCMTVPQYSTPEHAAPDRDMSSPPDWVLGSHRQPVEVRVRVADAVVRDWQQRVQQLLMSTVQAPFVRVAARWNALVLAQVSLYREALSQTPEMLQALRRAEVRVQNRIKLGLNSKMPVRFPPVIFHAPASLGGLDMLSVGGDSDDTSIPNVLAYVPSWAHELAESERVWRWIQQKRQPSDPAGVVDAPTVPSEWLSLGLPRLATLHAPERTRLALDHGWRLRRQLRTHRTGRYDPLWWTDRRHDGRLVALQPYCADMLQALGGVEGVLAHTLFPATGYRSWRGLLWGGSAEGHFEQTLAARPLTHAQRSGLSQVPNRRFTLWWSPTINRSRVYMGFRVQLDLTGIFMHGKLPTLKISLLQVFRAHLWQRIHESLVLDVCRALDRELGASAPASRRQLQVVKESVHPRKSYRLHWTCADIRLEWEEGAVEVEGGGEARPLEAWLEPSATGTSLSSRPDRASERRRPSSSASHPAAVNPVRTYWIDIQLRWGDVDDHDIAAYAAAKHREYTAPGARSLYPSPTGMLVAVDLAYRTWAGYGHGCAKVPQRLHATMTRVMQRNTALLILQDRVRKALQLYSVDTEEEATEEVAGGGTAPTAMVELPELVRGRVWWLDDTHTYRKHRNGAVLMWELDSGRLFVKVVHWQAWAGQSRRTQLARWKAAEELLALLRSLPDTALPRAVVVPHVPLLDPVRTLLAGSGSGLQEVQVCTAGRALRSALPMDAWMAYEPVCRLVDESPISQLLVLDAYAPWVPRVSVLTAMSRWALVLRALHRRPAEAAEVLGRGRGGSEDDDDDAWWRMVQASGRLWPSAGDGDEADEQRWMQLERQLQPLAGSATPKNVEDERPLTAADVAMVQELEAAPVPAFDRYGHVVQVHTSTPYERRPFRSGEEMGRQQAQRRVRWWRQLLQGTRYMRAADVDAEVAATGQLVVPYNLLRLLLLSGQSEAAMLGVVGTERRVMALWMPPEWQQVEAAVAAAHQAAGFPPHTLRCVGRVYVRGTVGDGEGEASDGDRLGEVQMRVEVREADEAHRDESMIIADIDDDDDDDDDDRRRTPEHAANAATDDAPAASCILRATCTDIATNISRPLAVQLERAYDGFFLSRHQGTLCIRDPDRLLDRSPTS